MNPKDIRTSSDQDLAGSFAAMQRAARSAQDLAIRTNTSIVVLIDGKNVELTAADLIKMREEEAKGMRHEQKRKWREEHAHFIAAYNAVVTAEGLPLDEWKKARQIPLRHPGTILLEDWLNPLGISQYALAKAIDVSPRRINEIVKGQRGITVDTALRLAAFFGTDAQSWVNLQTHYDTELAENRWPIRSPEFIASKPRMPKSGYLD